ncbi:MAG: hypothetical protein ACXVZO_02095 [Gaiellaceae bacterium]
MKATHINAACRGANRGRLAACLILLLGGALLAAIAAGGDVATGAARPDLVTIDHYGFWTMRKLGYPDEVRHHAQADLARKPIYYALPAGASQGPKDWYIVRLHVRVTVDPDSGPGMIEVGASTDMVGCADLVFIVKRVNGQATISWATSGIVDGFTRGRSDSNVADVRYSNYVTMPGTKPGVNTLDFQVGPVSDAVKLEEVRFVASDSGIEFSPIGPADVELHAHLASKPPFRVGDKIRIAFTLRNSGERTATRITVSPVYEPKLLKLVSASRSRFAKLRSGQVVTGSFVFLAQRVGFPRVFLGGDSSSNAPGDDVSFAIQPK